MHGAKIRIILETSKKKHKKIRSSWTSEHISYDKIQADASYLNISWRSNATYFRVANNARIGE